MHFFKIRRQISAFLNFCVAEDHILEWKSVHLQRLK